MERSLDIQYQEGRNAIAAPEALACVPISDWHPPWRDFVAEPRTD